MAAFKFSDKTKAIVAVVIPFATTLIAHYAGADSDAVFVTAAVTAAATGIGVYVAPNAARSQSLGAPS